MNNIKTSCRVREAASRLIVCALTLALVSGCVVQRPASEAKNTGEFGALVMAHGGRAEWNRALLAAVEPLRGAYDIEVVFGMADAAAIQMACAGWKRAVCAELASCGSS